MEELNNFENFNCLCSAYELLSLGSCGAKTSSHIAMFMDGPSNHKHYHISETLELPHKWDILGLDDNSGTNYEIRSIHTIEYKDFTKTFYFCYQLVEVEVQLCSPDAMVYQAPDPNSEAEKEMLEWDKILHPERYK